MIGYDDVTRIMDTMYVQDVKPSRLIIKALDVNGNEQTEGSFADLDQATDWLFEQEEVWLFQLTIK